MKISTELGHGVVIERGADRHVRVVVSVETGEEDSTDTVILSKAWACLAEAITLSQHKDREIQEATPAAAEGETDPARPPGTGAWWNG